MFGGTVLDRLLADLSGVDVHFVSLDWVPILRRAREE